MRMSNILTRHYPGCLDTVIAVNTRVLQKLKHFTWSCGLQALLDEKYDSLNIGGTVSVGQNTE